MSSPRGADRRAAAEATSAPAVAIRFLTAPTGTVSDVVGREIVADRPGIHEVTVSVASGATDGLVTSSWPRPGHLIATGAGGWEAEGPAAAASLITFAMDEEMAYP
jgi:hypothetical protein